MWRPGTPGLPRSKEENERCQGASLAPARARQAKRCHGETSAASRTIILLWHLLASRAATLTSEQELDTQDAQCLHNNNKGQISKQTHKENR